MPEHPGLLITSDIKEQHVMEISFFPGYLIAITLLTITPGVDTMLIIRNTSRGGFRDGAFSSLGICSGLFVHAGISAVGISVILLHTAWAFMAFKLVGACYLMWLGINNWKEVLSIKQPILKPGYVPVSTGFKPMSSLREGFLSNVLNPKTAVFYMAFLPQFITPSGSALMQSLMLAGYHFMIAMIWQCFLAITVNQAGKWLQKPRVSRIMGGVTGTVMIAFGLKLAVDR
jgi:threonine/homoserine/homoserine lactone efflux protein